MIFAVIRQQKTVSFTEGAKNKFPTAASAAAGACITTTSILLLLLLLLLVLLLLLLLLLLRCREIQPWRFPMAATRIHYSDVTVDQKKTSIVASLEICRWRTRDLYLKTSKAVNT